MQTGAQRVGAVIGGSFAVGVQAWAGTQTDGVLAVLLWVLVALGALGILVRVSQ